MGRMRCFIAIELDPDTRERLTELQNQLSGIERAVRWTRADQLHLTLKFFGDVSDADVAQVCRIAQDVAAQIPAFDLIVRGTGCFPPGGNVRIVWAGLPDPPPELVACQQTLEEAYVPLGFPKENRPFRPHLTLGRVKDPGLSRRIREAVQTHESFSAGSFTASELVVFQSILSPKGPEYTPLAHAAFRPAC
ncbi:MAG: hypothetical protein AMXMBFR13_48320 [Phycisphaerae bacterium]